jgi:hypothetical protein
MNFPSKPLSLPRPFGNLLEVEFNAMRFEFRQAAFKKMIRA